MPRSCRDYGACGAYRAYALAPRPEGRRTRRKEGLDLRA